MRRGFQDAAKLRGILADYFQSRFGMDAEVGVRRSLSTRVHSKKGGISPEQRARQELLHGVQFVFDLQPQPAAAREEIAAGRRLNQANDDCWRVLVMQSNCGEAGCLGAFRPVSE